MAETLKPGSFPYVALGHRIAELRNRLGISQERLAELAGISKGYPGRIETGRNRPDPQVLRDIARVLGADYQELAALADYTNQEYGEQIIHAPEEKAPILRRFLHYSVDRLNEAEAWLRIVGLDSAPPKEAGEESRNDAHGVAEQDEAEADDQRPAGS